MNNTLHLEKVSSFYGTSQILRSLDLCVAQGTVACLLGLNGMGKTTTLRTIMGLVDRVEGRVSLNGVELVGPTHRRSRKGVTLVHEDRKVFSDLTVQENMAVAVNKRKSGMDFTFRDATRLFPRLKERLRQKASTLSGGEQQMLVMARALLANPIYMLLDEPTEGLAPNYVEAIKESIEAARERSMGVILVEQNLSLALSVGDDFYILNNGEITFSDSRDHVISSPAIIEEKLTIE